jgi:hypothetical protein
MRKATAIYHAPGGDNKVVEMGGVTFFDGQSVDLNSNDHDHLIGKLANNQHFEFDLGEEVADDKPRRGRPPKNRDFKEGLTEANDHDFESDRRAALAGRKSQEPDANQRGQPNGEGAIGFTGTSSKPA